MTLARRPRHSATLSAFVLGMSAAACSAPSTESQWSLSVAAPAPFVLKVGAEGISLPATQIALSEYMSKAGGDFYVTGEGEARLISSPQPRPDALCEWTPKAVVYSFPIEAKFMPGYLAYVDANGLVVCVDKYFSYSGL